MDTSCCVAMRMSYLGIVIKDHTGVFVATRRSSVMAHLVLAAEALSIVGGCLLARELGFPNIVVESDSNTVISLLLGSIHLGGWEAFLTLARFLQLGEFFQACRWFWTPRTTYLEADKVASRSFQEMDTDTWVVRPSSSLVHVLNYNNLPCPSSS